LTDDFPAIPPEEGIVERDAATGKLNGRFEEWSAHHLIGKYAPPLSEVELEAAIVRVQQALNKEGITSHTDCVGQGLQGIFFGVAREEIVGIYEKMRREGKLTARVNLTINPCRDGVESYERITSCLDSMKLPEFADRNWVKADAIKLFGDQGLWLRDGNPFPGGTGRSIFPGETDEAQACELTRTIVEIHKRGWQVCIHAIGGKTIDTAIDAFAKAQETAPRQTPRHYVIHADDLTPKNAEKMAKYDIGASVQPIACNIVAGMRVPVMTAGEEEFDWQRYIDKGVCVAGGTDAPCFSFNWRAGVQFAVTRTTVGGEAIRPDLAMNLADAIRMYTYYGAYQEHMEDVRGSLEINKVADFQVLGRDIFTCPPSEISQIPVEMTICAGKVVYDAAADAS
jgi:predicted amidohydrolase YtcJ